MSDMEHGERMPRPEFDRTNPGMILHHACARQQWLIETYQPHALSDAIEGLSLELEEYLAFAFPSQPDVRVQTPDVHVSRVTKSEDGTYVIEAQPLPLEGDAAERGEHILYGKLFGFHKGDQNVLRTLVATNEPPLVVGTGVFRPLLSVALNEASIQLVTTRKQEQLQSIRKKIVEALIDCSDEECMLERQITEVLDNESLNRLEKLQHCSSYLGNYSKTISTKLIDDLLDYIRVELELNLPNDIKTTAHKVVLTKGATRSHVVHGAARFEGVTAQLGLMGESAHRTLGLSINKDIDEIGIPVEFVTDIRKSIIAT